MPTPIDQLDKKYLIHVGKKGTFFPDKNLDYNTSPEQIDAIFQHLLDNNKTRLLLYFHGGLVSAERGLANASTIIENVVGQTDSHPICFIWKTDLIRTVLENFDTISKSALFKKILVKVLWSAGNELGIEPLDALGNAKGTGELTEDDVLLELSKDLPFSNYSVTEGSKSISGTTNKDGEMSDLDEVNLTAELYGRLNRNAIKDPEFEEILSREIPKEEEELIKTEYTEVTEEGGRGLFSFVMIVKGMVSIAIRVIKRFRNGTHHDFHPTVVEEIVREVFLADLGNWVWGNMKEKAADMWKQDGPNVQDQSRHVGYYFISKLDEFQQRTGKKLTIDLIGHSAGSIVICHLLKLISSSKVDITFRNIFFLAPACRSDLFHDQVLKNQHLYSSFKCFTMKDEVEKEDKVFHNIYPYSLLYAISGILEEESDAQILGLQRHASGRRPYDKDFLIKIAEYLKIEGHSIYSKTDADVLEGLRSLASTHGGFSEEKETLKSLIYLIKK